MGRDVKRLVEETRSQSVVTPPRGADLERYRGRYVALRGLEVVADSDSMQRLMADQRVDLDRDTLLYVRPR